MVSHEHKCIFVHIPKSAGTSIIRALSDKNPAHKKSNNYPFRDLKNLFSPPPPHLRVEDHVTYGLASREQADAYFKFCFVRNPWDRIVSEYKYRGYMRAYTFKDYVFKQLPSPSWSDWYCHIIPQYDFVHDDNGVLQVDFVGKFETLKQDFSIVCEKLSLPQLHLPHRNTSLSIFNRRDNDLRSALRSFLDRISPTVRKNTFASYAEYYDDETREFIAELYKNDIRAFGYSFES